MKEIGNEDYYNIQMALIRNYGYTARKVANADDGALALEVIDSGDRVLMTITPSLDGGKWVIKVPRGEPFEIPVETPLDELIDKIVAELERTPES
ncbi:hypothetical protein [Mycobacterium sp. ENV421]|uniref:hypothetical protein n=1 Tax=Mycobacterium sp. ENV421 TaxID=1213407 RepID=UPI00115A6231|nr:hypothetical protein [Mycobacterium sp. ENV421]